MWHRVSRRLCLRHRKPSKLEWHFLRAFQGSLGPHVCKPGMSQDRLLRVQLCATWQHELWQNWDVMFLMFNEQPRSLERVLNGMGITSFPKGWEVGGEFEKKILVSSWVNLCDSRRTWACWLEKTTVVLECQYELVVGNEGWHVCKCSFDCKLDFKNKYNQFWYSTIWRSLMERFSRLSFPSPSLPVSSRTATLPRFAFSLIWLGFMKYLPYVGSNWDMEDIKMSRTWPWEAWRITQRFPKARSTDLKMFLKKRATAK